MNPREMSPDFLLTGLLTYIVFLFSTTCHEAAHAYVALRGGDPTAAEGGQVSLNPLPHIRREPFGMVLLPILSLWMSGGMVGWASAPYNPAWQRAYPRRAALMSLAGPAPNFLLVIVSGLLLRVGLTTGMLQQAGAMNAVYVILSIAFRLNLLLGIFNMLPFPPFDGFGVLGLLTGNFAPLENLRLRLRQFSIIGLLLGWQAMNVLYPPAYQLAARILIREY
jgi:Zn-dependent protease